MSSMPQLRLHHEIMLLALCDKKGTFQSTMYPYALAGAMLTELVLLGRIRVESGRSKRVELMSAQKIGDAVLDDLLRDIATSAKPRRLDCWVGHAVAMKQLTERIASKLCEWKILREVEKKGWFISQKQFPEFNSKFERAIKTRMSKLLFGQTAHHHPRTTALIALAKHTGLLAVNFDKDRLKRNQRRVDRVVSGDMYSSRATKRAVEKMESAMAIATLMPAFAGC